MIRLSKKLAWKKEEVNRKSQAETNNLIRGVAAEKLLLSMAPSLVFAQLCKHCTIVYR